MLSLAERIYSTPEREGLAAILALETLCTYLLYKECIVHIDHAAVR